MGLGALDLGQAALHQSARVGELLRHHGEGAGQSAQFVAGGEDLGRTQVAAGHLAHTLGQHHQRPAELVAEAGRHQQRAEDAEDERQRQRADVHLAQTAAAEGALLILAVGGLHAQGIGGQLRRHELGDLQVAVLAAEAEAVGRHPGDRPHACLAGGLVQRVGWGVRVQTFELGEDAQVARLAHHGAGRPVGQHGGSHHAARRHDHLPGGRQQRHALRRKLLAQALQRQQLEPVGIFGRVFGGQAGLGGDVVDQQLQRGAAEVEAGFERALDLDIEPALDRARDELVGHAIDQRPRQHADEGEDGRQLEQQLAAELAVAHAPRQVGQGDQDHQPEGGGHADVDPQQPLVVPLVQGPVVGGDREQEGQHQHGATHRQQGDQQGPAQGTAAHVGRVSRAGRWYAPHPVSIPAGCRCRSAVAGAAVRCRACR